MGEIVTFGPMPSRPETGYGYLELSDVTPNLMVFAGYEDFMKSQHGARRK